MAKVNYGESPYLRQEPPEMIRPSDVVTLLREKRELEDRLAELEAENERLRQRLARFEAAGGEVVAAYRSDQAHKIYAAAGRLAAVLEVAE